MEKQGGARGERGGRGGRDPQDIYTVVTAMEPDTDYVEIEGLDVGSTLQQMVQDEAETIKEYDSYLAGVFSYLAEEDIETIRGIISDEREHQTILTTLATKYDGTGVGKDAIKSLKKLLQEAEKGK